MKLGVFMALFGGQPFETALDYVRKAGLQTVEIGVGNYPGSPHCPVEELLASTDKATDWKKKITSRGLEISAFSFHGNPLHPDVDFARKDIQVMHNASRLARVLGVKTLIGFTGCPGGGPDDRVPNWITCPWPPDFANALAWQQSERLDPCWALEAVRLDEADQLIGFEMHPGFVHNTAAQLEMFSRVEKLLADGMRGEDGGPDTAKIDRVMTWLASVGAVGPDEVEKMRDILANGIGDKKAKNVAARLCVNFDPSHLFWQGMDPLVSLKALRGRVAHVHMKDCRIDGPNTAFKGVLDTMHYGNENERSWIFRTIGYGHGEAFWRDFVSTLRVIGYDGALSIEHEDSLMSVNEGFQKAVAFLKNIILTEKTGGMWWA